jgi:hypothetical protein
VTDIVRASYVYNRIAELHEGITQFYSKVQNSTFRWERIKNRLDPRYDCRDSGGYRDILVNVRHESGIIVEIQFHICAMHMIKNEGGHRAYRKFRVIEERNKCHHNKERKQQWRG